MRGGVGGANQLKNTKGGGLHFAADGSIHAAEPTRKKKGKQKEREEKRASATTSASYLIDSGCIQKGKFRDKLMQKKENWKKLTIFRPFAYC